VRATINRLRACRANSSGASHIAVRAGTFNAAGIAIAYAGGYVVCIRTSPFSAVPVSMPDGELARAQVDDDKTPSPCTLPTRYRIAASAASSACTPRYSIAAVSLPAIPARHFFDIKCY